MLLIFGLNRARCRALVLCTVLVPVVSAAQSAEGPQFRITEIDPPIAFAGSSFTLTVASSPQLQKLIYEETGQREIPRVTILADGRQAELLEFNFPKIVFQMAEGVGNRPAIQIQYERYRSEPFHGLTILNHPNEVIPSRASQGTLVTLITGSEIPPRLQGRTRVLLNGDPVDIVEFSKTGIRFQLPELDPGAVPVTYLVEGVAGTSNSVTLEVAAGEKRPIPIEDESSWVQENLVMLVNGSTVIVVLITIGTFWWIRKRKEHRRKSVSKTDPHLPPLTGVPENLDRLPSGPIIIEKLTIKNFKNIHEIELELSAKSTLEGNWTCIAGINGSGKSTLLQAICVLLLGEKLAAELGSERLRRMLRREGKLIHDSDLQACVRIGESDPIRLHLPLGDNGVNESVLRSNPDYSNMRLIWDRLRHSVLVSYGATRNLSETRESRYDHLADQVRRQMTLFDPLNRIAGVDVLLEGTNKNAKALKTLHRLLLEIVGQDELAIDSSNGGDRLVFGPTGVDAIDLPDGFRSTVAWLADLCTTWHETAREGESRETDPAAITGIVLLDEIGLHLHPSLARSIVPRLRKALPRVQFIVTTHSPLVLSSFDMEELILLESDHEGRVERRPLDRQVFSFSMDEVYNFLMRTKPHSSVIEEKARQGDDPDFAKYLYQSENVDEEGAQDLVDDMARLLREIKDDGGDT